jgi:UDP-N-acetylglucosamine 1-carboxyvinyltransferase
MTVVREEPRLVVRGGRRLSGQVAVSGAKNSALKLMAASLLASGTTVLHNVPDIQDVHTMREVLEHLGAVVEFAEGTMTIDTRGVRSHVAPYELVQRMRASIQIMGPLVARFGHAKVAMPGGCNLGPRKIDIHLRGIAEMGATVRTDHGFIEVTAPRLKGIDMFLDYPSVGATENLLMAAVLAEGTTTLDNVAREPEVVDLCKFLTSMGADIEGAGSSTLRIRGVPEMRPAEHTVIGTASRRAPSSSWVRSPVERWRSPASAHTPWTFSSPSCGQWESKSRRARALSRLPATLPPMSG